MICAFPCHPFAVGSTCQPCLPTSHRWGEACEGFSSFGPTQLVASRAYVTFVFLESFLETCLHPLLGFRLDFGISRAMLWLQKVWAPWLRRRTPPHSTWDFRSRCFCLHPRWRADPSSHTSFHFPHDGIPEDRKVDWVDEWTTTHLSYCFQRVFKHFQDV